MSKRPLRYFFSDPDIHKFKDRQGMRSSAHSRSPSLAPSEAFACPNVLFGLAGKKSARTPCPACLFMKADRSYKSSGLIIVFFLVLTSYILAGCAPQVIAPQPPRYEKELSLGDIVTKAGADIQALKAVADIEIEKNGERIEQTNASVLLQRPDRVHMRVYKFGMLTGDIVMRDGELLGPAGGRDTKLAGLIGEFFHAVFWWDDLEGASLYAAEDAYIIKTVNQEIHLDKATLLPVMQVITSGGKNVHITYSGPQNYEGWWYPSNLTISADDFRFSVKIERLIKNPPLGEADFRIHPE